MAEFQISSEKVSLQQMNLAIFFKSYEMGFKSGPMPMKSNPLVVLMAAELESTSAEHLMVITDEGIQ